MTRSLLWMVSQWAEETLLLLWAMCGGINPSVLGIRPANLMTRNWKKMLPGVSATNAIQLQTLTLITIFTWSFWLAASRAASQSLMINLVIGFPWWHHQMETFSALLALCEGNSLVTDEFPHKGQWRGALMFSLICVLSKQSKHRLFETPSRPLSRHFNALALSKMEVREQCKH